MWRVCVTKAFEACNDKARCYASVTEVDKQNSAGRC